MWYQFTDIDWDKIREGNSLGRKGMHSFETQDGEDVYPGLCSQGIVKQDHPSLSIDCHQEVDDYIRLPRGCYDEFMLIVSDLGVTIELNDERERGNAIAVVFTGVLRENQCIAAEALLQKGDGIL